MPKHNEYTPVFHVGNKHSQDCGNPPHVDGNIRKRYHGYFENEFGEQAIFVYDYEVGEGTLWMGDAGWETPYKVIDGRVLELELGRNETLWLYNCWITATAQIPK